MCVWNRRNLLRNTRLKGALLQAGCVKTASVQA
jgi:hypothetical protein